MHWSIIPRCEPLVWLVQRRLPGRCTPEPQQTANARNVRAAQKIPLLFCPDANIEDVAQVAAESAFGCAGQRCLAASLAITVGDAAQPFIEAMADVASRRNVGYGLDAGVEMGPVIRAESKARIEQLIQTGIDDGAQAIVDGPPGPGRPIRTGYFVKPTLLTDVQPSSPDRDHRDIWASTECDAGKRY